MTGHYAYTYSHFVVAAGSAAASSKARVHPAPVGQPDSVDATAGGSIRRGRRGTNSAVLTADGIRIARHRRAGKREVGLESSIVAEERHAALQMKAEWLSR